MGLPAGHVTDVPDLPRTAQLKALGNGVVPQQAALALTLLGGDVVRHVSMYRPTRWDDVSGARVPLTDDEAAAAGWRRVGAWWERTE